jgi:hypothetical protein
MAIIPNKNPVDQEVEPPQGPLRKHQRMCTDALRASSFSAALV